MARSTAPDEASTQVHDRQLKLVRKSSNTSLAIRGAKMTYDWGVSACGFLPSSSIGFSSKKTTYTKSGEVQIASSLDAHVVTDCNATHGTKTSYSFDVTFVPVTADLRVSANKDLSTATGVNKNVAATRTVRVCTKACDPFDPSFCDVATSKNCTFVSEDSGFVNLTVTWTATDPVENRTNIEDYSGGSSKMLVTTKSKERPANVGWQMSYNGESVAPPSNARASLRDTLIQSDAGDDLVVLYLK